MNCDLLSLRHHLRARRILRVMHQHRRVEIALAEHHRDVRQMGTNRVTILGVRQIIDAHFDGAAVVEE